MKAVFLGKRINSLCKFQRDIYDVLKQSLILITKEIFMKYTLLAAVLITFTFSMTGCGKEPGEGKPGQYPPSLYKDESGERLGAPAGGK